MLTAQRVNNFITARRPAAVCDSCICKALHFNYPAHAAQITGALGTTSDFERRPGKCTICENERVVIHSRSRNA